MSDDFIKCLTISRKTSVTMSGETESFSRTLYDIFSWVYKRSMFVKLYVTVMYQCVYGNLISIMLRIVYLVEPPYGTLCLLVQITNR